MNIIINIILLVSADNSRPYLTSFQGNNFTDYINAVFVDVRTFIYIAILINAFLKYLQSIVVSF